MASADRVAEAFAASLATAREMWLPEGGSVPRVAAKTLNPDIFLREYVMRNRPVIITGAIDDWPAMKRWNPAYLASLYGDAKVTVNMTPNGWGDALVPAAAVNAARAADGSGDTGLEAAGPWFVMPEERVMPLKEALALLVAHEAHVDSAASSASGADSTAPAAGGSAASGSAGIGADFIAYVSYQNDNMRAEVPAMLEEIKPLPFSPWAGRGGAGAAAAAGGHGDDDGDLPDGVMDDEEAELLAALLASEEEGDYLAEHWSPDPDRGAGGSSGGAASGGSGTKPSPAAMLAMLRAQRAAMKRVEAEEAAAAAAAVGGAATAATSGMADVGADAINFWIGDSRSTSACHKDHYENLYAVLRGCKIFTLLAPCEVLFMHERMYPVGRFRHMGPRGMPPAGAASAGSDASAAAASTATTANACCTRDGHQWTIDGVLDPPSVLDDDDSDDDSSGGASGAGGAAVAAAATAKDASRRKLKQSLVPWISVDPAPARRAEMVAAFPRFKHAQPLQVRVEAGEVLYLPALWYHQVAQEGLTMAVNFWHDMEYQGPSFAYYNMCRDMAKAIDSM